MNQVPDKKLLITGASGLLGINLALNYGKDFEVLGSVNDHLLTDEYFQVVQADLLEDGSVEKMISSFRPDWVINCAALADIGACEADPKKAEQLNAVLPGRIARHARQFGARLIHVSTDAVFDGRTGGYSESSPPNPINVYARTKLAGEKEVLNADPEVLVVRLNLFGWSRSGKRSLAEFFFNNLSREQTVPGFTDVYFNPILANDLADIFLQLLKSNSAGIYHLGSPEKISKYNFGLEISQRFGFSESLIRPLSLDEANLKVERGKDLTLLTDKFEASFSGTVPELSTGLDRFYELYQQGYPQKVQNLSQHNR